MGSPPFHPIVQPVQPEPFDAIGAFSRLALLRRLAQEENIRGEQLRDLRQERATQQAIREAARGAVVNQPELVSATTPVLPARTRFDRLRFLQELGQRAPEQVLGFEQQFAQQSADAAKQQREIAEHVAKMSKEEREAAEFRLDRIGRAAFAVLQAPPELKAQVYASARQDFLSSRDPLIRQMGEQAPPNYTPEIEPWLQQQAFQAKSIKDLMGEARQARPVAGRDVPLPKDVEAQKIRISRFQRLPERGLTPAQQITQRERQDASLIWSRARRLKRQPEFAGQSVLDIALELLDEAIGENPELEGRAAGIGLILQQLERGASPLEGVR